MAHGLEVRVPFIDYTVVTFANGFDTAGSCVGDRGRMCSSARLRMCCRRRLHRARVRGFGFPLEHDPRAEFTTPRAEVLFDAGLQDVCDRREVEFLWKAHQSGRSNFAQALWCQLMFNLWYQRWCRRRH